MKHLSNTNRTNNCWNQFGREYVVWDAFLYSRFLSFFIMKPTPENLWIKKLSTGKKIRPLKYQREKKLDLRITHVENFWNHEKPTRKKFWPTKFLQKNILDPQNTHEKKFWTQELFMKKNFRPSKYPCEKISDLQNTHESTKAR